PHAFWPKFFLMKASIVLIVALIVALCALKCHSDLEEHHVREEQQYFDKHFMKHVRWHAARHFNLWPILGQLDTFNKTNDYNFLYRVWGKLTRCRFFLRKRRRRSKWHNFCAEKEDIWRELLIEARIHLKKIPNKDLYRIVVVYVKEIDPFCS